MKTYEHYKCNNPWCEAETDTRYIRGTQQWFTVTRTSVESPSDFSIPRISRNVGIEGDYCSLNCLLEIVEDLEKKRKEEEKVKC